MRLAKISIIIEVIKEILFTQNLYLKEICFFVGFAAAINADFIGHRKSRFELFLWVFYMLC